MSENRCVCCDEIIPEGRQVCPQCEKKEKVQAKSEIKLTIDEVIEHCETHIEVGERVFTKEELNIEPFMCNSIKQYWEHKQVAEWLKELKHLRGAMERIVERIEFLEHRTIDGEPYVNMNYAIEVVKEEGGIE